MQFEILARPPTRAAADNPWPQWPRVYKLDYGQEEAAALFGADPRAVPDVTKSFVGDAAGNVKELHTVQVEWVKNGDGRLAMKEMPGTEQVWPAELVLLAMGFLGPEKPGLLTELGVELDGAATSPSTATRRPASPASSPPATWRAASRSSSGRSTKVAAPPAASIAI